MNKEELRQQVRTERLEMPTAEVEAKSAAIADRLIKEVDWAAIKSMHTYIPMARLNEVNTWPILKHIWLNYPQIITAVPVGRRRGEYEAVRVSEFTRWRGLVPGNRKPMPNDCRFDLVIVPTLAFDKEGYRLGWGQGFYDSFLASQPAAEKIGLCFANGLVAAGIPAELHDIQLDKVITDV